MFGLFRKQDNRQNVALSLYKAAMNQSRHVWIYESAQVPDSYDGRFDSLLLHLYCIVQRLNSDEAGRVVAQDLFDVAIADFDQSLREIGVGDTGLKRRMKNMLLAFNGRMHAYDLARSEDDFSSAMREALLRNVYGSVNAPPDNAVDSLVAYMQRILTVIDAQNLDDIRNGIVTFPVIQED